MVEVGSIANMVDMGKIRLSGEPMLEWYRIEKDTCGMLILSVNNVVGGLSPQEKRQTSINQNCPNMIKDGSIQSPQHYFAQMYRVKLFPNGHHLLSWS